MGDDRPFGGPVGFDEGGFRYEVGGCLGRADVVGFAVSGRWYFESYVFVVSIPWTESNPGWLGG